MDFKDSAENPGTDVAIIGMGCRFPGADSCEQFWRNLRDGVESIFFFSEQELRSAGVSDKWLGSSDYVRARGILRNIDLFDASFFDFSPREAEILDPQHRIFLECAWHALEIAGYDTERYSRLIGIYAGSSLSRYLFNLYSNPAIVNSIGEFQVMVGNDKDHLASRIAYKLNLRGPSVTVQTACSTSLVAVHLACQALLSGDCDIALAGGVSITVPEVSGYNYHPGGILSPDGHCRAFDASAQGTVSGNGAGIVVLKRLEDALEDRDNIEAVIKGSAINNDGALRLGYTAPGIQGQANVIAAALAIAAVPPETIDYIEAHGTGTPLGDSVECAGLIQAFGGRSQTAGRCAIGSVKTNIGHLDASAGVAGLIKTVLALKHKEIPASLHFHQLGPEIKLDSSRFYVNSQLRPWPSVERPRRAGVSSFGLGGTNAHVVLESASESSSLLSSRNWHLLLLSSKAPSGIEKMCSNLGCFLEEHTGLNIADVAFTLSTGRRRFPNRFMLVCRDRSDATDRLCRHDSAPMQAFQLDVCDSSVAFAFPGLGEHYVNMGFDLYKSEEVFRKNVDACAEILRPCLGLDIRDILYPERATEENSNILGGVSSEVQPRFDLRRMLSASRREPSAAEERLNKISLLHPAIFAIEYSLAQLWISWGLRPSAMVGYSIGEYVAACVAKVFSLEDALALVSQRSKLIENLPSGAMVAISCSADEVRPLLGEDSAISAINGPAMCVASGSERAVVDLERRLDRLEIAHRRLQASHAFHSDSMVPIGVSLKHELGKIRFHRPQIPFVSTVTGTWITDSEAMSIEYWLSHIWRPVRFAEAVESLWRKKNLVLLEVGPGQGLTSLSLQHPIMDPAAQLAIRSMRSMYERQDDNAVILDALGRLWLAGVEPDWKGYWAGERRRRVPLPGYPFERRRYWIEAQRTEPLAPASNGASAKKDNPADWFLVPQWRQISPLPALEFAELSKRRTRWLLFTDGGATSMRLSERLIDLGQTVVSVNTGSQFDRSGDHIYTINPADQAHYIRLIQELQACQLLPEQVLHCWNLGRKDENEVWKLELAKNLDLGFYSLIFLIQAVTQLPGEPELKILAAADSIARITGDEQINPVKVTLFAPCKVIPQECPHITCRAIDIQSPDADSPEMETLISQLIAEALLERDDPEVAYRGKARWIKAYEPVRLEDDQGHKALLRDGGTYLIAGGLGGMGLEFAQYLARNVRVQLALIGRSAFPEEAEWDSWLESHPATNETSRKIQKLQDILKTGTKVSIFSADVSDEQEMRQVVDQITTRFGQVHGIIHSAGIAGGGIIALKTREAADAVLASKLQGTLVLDRLFRNTKLDFFVACSSLTSVLGGAGQVDYCAANMFLDSFAHTRRDCFTVAINWDTWRDVGMALNHRTNDSTHGMDERMKAALSPQEGIEAFRRVLGSRYNQVLVSARNMAAASRPIDGDNGKLSFRARPASSHARPQLRVSYVAPRNSEEETIAHIWQELLGVNNIGIYDNFFELGGNSLLAVRIISRLRAAFRLEIPLQTLLQAITVESLANLVQHMVKVSLEGQTQNHHDKIPVHSGNQAYQVTPGNQRIDPAPYVVELQNGSKRPLFLVHPAGGTVFVYRDLAIELGSDQTVYGIRAHGTAPGEVPLNRIEEMAVLYVDAVRAIQPSGPYQLAGLSQGGMIAFEMAQRLHELGGRISFLGMFDTPGITQLPVHALDDAEMFKNMFGKLIPESLDYLRQLDSNALHSYVLNKLQHYGGLTDVGMVDARRFLDVWKANIEALECYTPTIFPGRISFFRAMEWLPPNPEHPELAWISFSGEGIEIFEVPGNHHTMIVPPHVSALAAHLRRCMRAGIAESYDKTSEDAFKLAVR